VHEGHRTSSPDEARFVRDEIARLVGTPYVDEHGERAVRHEDVVVVAPYNAQVRCLRAAIPDQRVRIGTVDKFQGQEAELVIVSMTTSSEHDLPRFMEFLYSKNRLNVAISRARCTAIVIANPALMAIRCRTPEQMALVNTLCWVAEAGRR
jgi:superfamily I DNA and/or RNA helicase